jgi:hypothetical protein
MVNKGGILFSHRKAICPIFDGYKLKQPLIVVITLSNISFFFFAIGASCEIFNTDQGSQFTTPRFTQPLLDKGIKVSMDGRGRALDNIFVERLWRSVKYEKIYLNDFNTVNEAYLGLKEYFEFYNNKRFHQSLDNQTPADVHLAGN